MRIGKIVVTVLCLALFSLSSAGISFSQSQDMAALQKAAEQGDAKAGDPLAVTFSEDGTPIFPSDKTLEELVAKERFKKIGDVLVDTVMAVDLHITPHTGKRAGGGIIASTFCKSRTDKDKPGLYTGRVWSSMHKDLQLFYLSDDTVVYHISLTKEKKQRNKKTYIHTGHALQKAGWSDYVTVLGDGKAYISDDFDDDVNDGIDRHGSRRMCLRAYNWNGVDGESFNDHYKRIFKQKVVEKYAKIYTQIKANNTIKAYEAFIARYPNASMIQEARVEIELLQADQNFPDVVKQNNIAGYAWFINTYPHSPLIKDALQKMYQAGFDLAAKENTVEAYNDFIVGFPLAPQTKQAMDAAYDLEAKQYKVGMFGGLFGGGAEKNARAVLVKSMQFYRLASNTHDARKSGYLMIVERMNRLLENEFPAEQATVDHLKSEEFRAITGDLKKSLASIKDSLNAIQGSVANVSSLLSEQTSVMDRHFRDAAQSRALSEELAEQHRFWERYMQNT